MYKKLLFNLFVVLTTSSIVGADIYLWEDFEGFSPGESLDTTGVWVQQGSAPLGVASNAMSYPAGGISGYFEEQAGIRHMIPVNLSSPPGIITMQVGLLPTICWSSEALRAVTGSVSARWKPLKTTVSATRGEPVKRRTRVSHAKTGSTLSGR